VASGGVARGSSGTCIAGSAPSDLRALILAGGAGTRLRSIVSDRPKPMADFGEQPFLEFQIRWLRRQGISRILLCVGYKHEKIQSHFGDGRPLGVEIEYSLEKQALGTGGALKRALARSHDTFLALNGDSFFDLHLSQLLGAHLANKASHPRNLGTLALVSVADAREFGSVELDPRQRILRFAEKSQHAPGPALVSAGIYVLEPELFEGFQPDRQLSLEHEIFPAALASGRGLFGHVAEGFFVDIGTPGGYRRFQHYVEQEQQQR
jgi:NDP-sugar pyrophosphorylase family protein